MVKGQNFPSQRIPKEGLIMQEILTIATYLVGWLLCKWVFRIESGLITLLISLGAAVGVYVAIAIKEYEDKKKRGHEE